MKKMIVPKKATLLTYGIIAIAAGALLLLDALGILVMPVLGLSPFRIFLTVALFGLFIYWLFDCVVLSPFALALAFMSGEPAVAALCGKEEDFIHNGLVILIAMLLSVGISLLKGAFGGKNKGVSVVHRPDGKKTVTVTGLGGNVTVSRDENGKKTVNVSDGAVEVGIDGDDDDDDDGKVTVNCNGYSWACSGGMGTSTAYVEGYNLRNALIEDVVGTADVYVTEKDSYKGDGKITVSDVVGKVVLHIPAEWYVRVQSVDCLGNVHVPNQDGGTFTYTLDVLVTDLLGTVTVVKE